MDPNQITQMLHNAASSDLAIRSQAEQWLQEAEKHNYPLFIQMMVHEVTNNERIPQVRQLAAIILKNTLTAKDDANRLQKAQKWMSLDPTLRTQAKAAILAILASPIREVRAATASLLAKIGQIELPKNTWPELIPTLLANMQQENEALKQSTLETLGYICEEIEIDVLASQSNQILTAVCKGIKDNSNEVKLAGCKSLLNALPFVRANFEKELERNYIMQVVCEAAAVPEVKVRDAAFACIAQIAENYYDKLGPYMQKLFNITLEAIKKDEESVALQAIEFWSTICDEEIEIAAEAEEAFVQKVQVTRISQNFVKGALEFLVPLLTECLTRQEDDPEEGSWNVAMAAATCIGLIATAVEDDIIRHVMPFVLGNINNENWKFRDAATLAFGSILEGPKNYVSTLTAQAMPVLISHLKDPVEHVKDTTAWTIGRILLLHPTTIGNAATQLVTVLLEALKDSPKVVVHVCYCIHNFALAYEDDQDGPTSGLSPYFQAILQSLVAVTEREDADENNLRSCSYEAINMVISCGAADTVPVIQQLAPLFIQKLHNTFAMPIVSADDKETQNELQQLLCGSLQVITQKLEDKIKPFADQIMNLLLQVFSTKSVSVTEEAMMAVGAIANAVEDDFDKYMGHFRPVLAHGLKSYEEYQVVTVSVGVIGDIARAIKIKIAPYCDEIVNLLLQGLGSPQMNRSVKCPIIATFGDIALAISGRFVSYLGVVMNILQQASSTTIDVTDPDLVDYLNLLRASIFEAYTGIVQGLHSDKLADPHLLPYINNMVHLCAAVAQDNNKSEECLEGALGLLGDIALSLGPKVKQQLTQPFVKHLISEGIKSSDKAKDVALWTKDLINKL